MNLQEHIEWLKISLEKVSVYNLDTHTAIELYYEIANRFNKVIEELITFETVVGNDIVEQNNKLNRLIEEGLTYEIVSKVQEMIADGTIRQIVDNEIFSEIRTDVNNNKVDIQSINENLATNNANLERINENLTNNNDNLQEINESLNNQGINQSLRVRILDNDDLRIAFKYNNDNDMFIDFGKCGVNELPQIKCIRLAPNNGAYVQDDVLRESAILIESYSDWVSPYIVRAVNNPTGDYPSTPRFTGGWHGSWGDATGGKTATNDMFDIQIGGKNITKGKTYRCSEVKAFVTNSVQAYNTALTSGEGRPVLYERLLYTFTENNIEVFNDIVPMENIVIESYYFLACPSMDFKYNIFRNSANPTHHSITDDTNNSGTKSESPNCDSVSLLNTNMYLNMWVDRNYNIGIPNYVSNTNPLAFNVIYGADSSKMYFNVINGIECPLDAYQIVSVVGGYNIASSSISQNYHSAFPVKRYGKDEILVNAYGSINDFLINKKWVGRKATIKNPKENTWVDSVMMPSGLKVSNTTGIAQSIDISID